MTIETMPKAVISDFFYYFAFGSNLLKERIRVQVKGAVFETIGVLKDYELGFFDGSHRWQGALASIEPKKGGEVWGCVWRVPNIFAQELDIQEDVYHRLNVPILIPHLSNKELMCRTYQYSNPERKHHPPSPHYKHVIVCGAVEHQLPIHYINHLQQMKDNGYCGPVELDLEVLDELNGKVNCEKHSGK